MTTRRIFRQTFKTITENWIVFNENVLKPLAKSILIPLRLTVVASETDATIHYKMFGFGTTTLITFNEEMNDIMKIVKSLEESSC